jgi:hypothetical protein
MVCCIQSQISEGAHENLYRQNAVRPVKTYSQTQLHVLALQSRKHRGKKKKLGSILFKHFCYINFLGFAGLESEVRALHSTETATEEEP